MAGKPEGIILTIDSREQKPLDFSGIDGINKIERIGLAYGDYSGLVCEKVCPIIVERKSLGDLWGTMLSGHERFKREMERAKSDNMQLILAIEGTYTDIWNGFERSKFDGPSMIALLNTMYVKYGLEFWLCESRRVMARRIVDLFKAVEKNWSVGS